MAPVEALLEAVQARAVQLEESRDQQKGQLDELEAEISAKRAEKSIAAQNAVRDLLKRKETVAKESNNLKKACELLDKALAKLQLASRLCLSDVASLHEEKVKLSDFARGRICGEGGQEALTQLRKASGSAEVDVKDGALHYAGSKESLARLKEALAALESNFELPVPCDDPATLRLMDSRGELTRIATKHGVEVVQEDGGVRVSGPQAAAEKAAGLLKYIFQGREDLDCPKSLVGAAKARAKEVEGETGALVEVLRTGGFAGEGVINIRGDEECVDQASEQLRNWLDEKEGALSQHVDISQSVSAWSQQLVNQFRGDLPLMANKFRIVAKEPQRDGRLELRGPSAAVAAAAEELRQILDFYKGEHAKATAAKAKPKAKAKSKPQPVEEDDWGAAPVAEPPPCSW